VKFFSGSDFGTIHYLYYFASKHTLALTIISIALLGSAATSAHAISNHSSIATFQASASQPIISAPTIITTQANSSSTQAVTDTANDTLDNTATNESPVTVTINGEQVPVPENGSISTQVPTGNTGQMHVDIQVQNSGPSTSSSQTFNVQSSTFSNSFTATAQSSNNVSNFQITNSVGF
jgi:hypothetical protein